MTDGRIFFSAKTHRDEGCPIHASCLNCPEKTCVESDNRLTHREHLWLVRMAGYLRYEGKDAKYPDLYNRAIKRLRDLAICISRAERKRQDLAKQSVPIL